MKILSRFWSRRSGALNTVHWYDIGTPDAIYAIGDIHGRHDLLTTLEAKLADDWKASGHNDVIILYLGDVIDRGPSSAHVLDNLIAAPPSGGRKELIRGNHEDMFLAFLKRPEANLEWLDQGGAETLGSYGIYLTASEVRRSSRQKIQQYLNSSIPRAHVAKLRLAPRAVVAGDWLFTHAGLDPQKPAREQRQADVTWGAAGDLTKRNETCGRIIFGHFAGESVRRVGHTTCIDTKAYVSGRLSAVRVFPGVPDGGLKFFRSTNF